MIVRYGQIKRRKSTVKSVLPLIYDKKFKKCNSHDRFMEMKLNTQYSPDLRKVTSQPVINIILNPAQ